MAGKAGQRHEAEGPDQKAKESALYWVWKGKTYLNVEK